MEVDIATARHTYEHEGQTYYFCCPGCQGRFVREPEKYLAVDGDR
jgi:YHS domain-containing protein